MYVTANKHLEEQETEEDVNLLERLLCTSLTEHDMENIIDITYSPTKPGPSNKNHIDSARHNLLSAFL